MYICVYLCTNTYVVVYAHMNTYASTFAVYVFVYICNICILMWCIVDNLYCLYVHSPIQHIMCNRSVFTNFLLCSHSNNPNNEACLVTCAVSLTCATWLMYAQLFLPPAPQLGYKCVCSSYNPAFYYLPYFCILPYFTIYTVRNRYVVDSYIRSLLLQI